MKTFEIKDGDFVLGADGFNTITGPKKVKQDLGVSLQEEVGTDRFHPLWGSIMVNFAGASSDPLTKAMIVSEIYRLVRNYVATQSDAIRSNVITGKTSRYTTDELVNDIASVDVRQEYDRLYLRVKITTQAAQSITLTSSMGV